MNASDPVDRLRAASPSPASPELDTAVVDGAPDRRAPRLVNRGRLVRGAGAAVGSVAVVSAVALGVSAAFPAAPSGPLFAAAASGSGSGSAAEESTMDADARMMMWVDYDYVAGADLSQDAGRGSVYQLRLAGTPQQLARDAASAFGLDGEPHEAGYSDPAYPSWVVGPEDGSAPSLSVSWSGTGGWWYSDPTAYPEPVCEVVEYTNEDGTTGSYDDCRTPEVPESASLAPSADEARSLAAALFAETGLDVSADAVRVTTDAYQTTASASLTVDGVATALEWSVAWSPLGEIAWASGHAVEVVDRGDFDTVSAVDAVERLEDGRWFGAAGPEYSGGAVAYAADALARDAVSGDADGAGSDGAPAEVPTDIPTEEAAPGSEPAPTPGTEPAPEAEPELEPAPEVEPDPEPEVLPEPEVDPIPEPEAVTVTLDRAEATLLLLWDVDGNAWLVPGYAYEQPEQGFWTAVVSLVEGVITLPEPLAVEAL